jgi:hypothetical protein
MTAGQILRDQFQWIHNTTMETIVDCTPETLSKTFEDSTIGAISGIYAHVVFAEDRQLHVLIKGEPMVFERGDWADKLGVRPPEGRMDLEWRSTQRMELESFMSYARDVYAAMDEYLAGVTDDELNRTITAFNRETTVGALLARTVATHMVVHLGEIAALKGVQGLKGLPM